MFPQFQVDPEKFQFALIEPEQEGYIGGNCGGGKRFP